ncbi:hypothetical protein GGR57DRAFT_462368 [Xylariaceae sp. FL1272]|nr:hypothetical protein GGR57DRAFT_462368 [Xylariaceae sp. FL1272]
MSEESLNKANKLMEKVFGESDSDREARPSNWPDEMTKSDYLTILQDANRVWTQKRFDATILQPIIDKVPRHKISNIVAIGLSNFASLEREGTIEAKPSILAQHLAVLRIGKMLSSNQQKVEVGISDYGYCPAERAALSDFGFTVLNPAYDKHKQFCAITDNTLFIALGLTASQAPYPVFCHYATPAAMICTFPYEPEPEHFSSMWSIIHDGTERVVVPGVSQSQPIYTPATKAFWERYDRVWGLSLGDDERAKITNFECLHESCLHTKWNDQNTIWRNGASIWVRQEGWKA